MKATVFLFKPKYLLFMRIFIRVFQLEFFRVLDSLSFLLVWYIVILTTDPVNPSLDPVTRWYGWRYLSLYHYYIYIYIFQAM